MGISHMILELIFGSKLLATLVVVTIETNHIDLILTSPWIKVRRLICIRFNYVTVGSSSAVGRISKINDQVTI